MTHNKRHGFMLVGVLSLSAFVLLLAFGMVFMAQTSQDISSNIRSNTRARYAAEAAIDTAHAIVRANPTLTPFTASGQRTEVPLTLSSVKGYYTIKVLSNTGTSALVQLVGQGQAERNASYETRAVVMGTRVPEPWLSNGLTSMRMVQGNGSGQYLNGASIHGNGGFDLHGGQQMLGDIYGSTPAGTITAGRSATVCNRGSGGRLCSVSDLVDDVNIPAPDYDQLLADNFPTCSRTITGDVTVTSQADFDSRFPQNTPVCVTGKLTLTASIRMNNQQVRVNQNLVYGQGGALASLTGSKLAVNNATPLQLNNTQITDSKVLVRGGLTHSGAMALDGKVSLIAEGPIHFNGSTRNNVLDKVELAVITEGDATFNGASDTRAVFWVGGTYHHNGSTRLYGSVSARGDIRLNGSALVTRVNNLNNDDLPGTFQLSLQSRK